MITKFLQLKGKHGLVAPNSFIPQQLIIIPKEGILLHVIMCSLYLTITHDNMNNLIKVNKLNENVSLKYLFLIKTIHILLWRHTYGGNFVHILFTFLIETYLAVNSVSTVTVKWQQINRITPKKVNVIHPNEPSTLIFIPTLWFITLWSERIGSWYFQTLSFHSTKNLPT